MTARGAEEPPVTGPSTTVYVRTADAVTRQVAQETLLVPIRGQLADLQQIFSINAVGALLWERLDGEHDIEALCAAVAEEFDVTAAGAEPSVRAFLAELVQADLIEERR